MAANSPSSDFSISQTRQLISDLFLPRPVVYWSDFLLTYAVGTFCFLQVRGGSLFVPHQGFRGDLPQTLYFIASCLLFYRAALFIHEVVHQRTAGRLAGFRFAWNVLCGIPLLIPSFIYYTHIDHHRRQHFGTERDGEYIPLAKRPRWHTLMFVFWSFVIPLLAIFRFLILTPFAWCIPGFRKLVHQRASSMVMDPSYIRPLPAKQMMRVIYLQETACFVWCVVVAAYAFLVEQSPILFLVHIYSMSVVIILLNSVRTLGAHRWDNDGEEMSLVDQVLDSVNYPRAPWLSELWGPVGTRFHALHHLFPSLPYHALPAAHRRLVQQLPADSPYRQTEEVSLTSGLVYLWNRRRAGKSAEN